MIRIVVRVKGVTEARRRLASVSGENLGRAIQKGLNRAGRQIATSAKERAPYRSGDLRREVTWRTSDDPLDPWFEVVVPPINGVPYGIYQHEGTGVYGPTGEPIRPKKASVLRFEVPGGIVQSKSGKYRRGPSTVVFAQEVKGVPPNPFLLDSVEAARGFGLVEKELAATILQAAGLEGPEGGEDA